MKTRILLATALLPGMFASAADNFRCVTVAATHGGPATIQIQQGETAELVSAVSTTRNGSVDVTFVKSVGGSGPWGFGIPLAGPATITANSGRWNTAVVTVKITPDSPDVNKTLMLRPGTNQDYVTLESSTNQVYVMLEASTNQVHVSLESSTNFVSWADATNGVYGSPDTVRFFRIRTKALTAH
jgi:hypothetical protein